MCNDMDNLFKPIIMVTGFGPFANHPVNASWEAVKLINKEEIERKHNCELVLIEIPVTYENVDEFVPALWETHSPKFMMHVGVSGVANCFTIEMQAHKKGYQRMDYFDKCPADHVCPAEGAIRIHTKLNVEGLCKEFNDSISPEEKTSAVCSKDAGRYLCEYIYYTSLSVDNKRTLFVHVPDINVYPSEQTARGLERILDICLDQINQAEQTKEVTEKLKETNLNDGHESNKI
ncbi:pyroglutamyl-peptidase 1 [Manduca sexta]|uniref:pyroglutamyl-peptidase 1 n=1 Tax=Manduca sexta TaxID=7130 RepID=UPI00188E9459|nr:pyroglutamyl-peptidase 1 [Manduca sexta]